MNVRAICGSAILVAFCVFGQQRFVSTQTPAGPYFLDDLGTLGGAESRALGVNENADVVGSAQRADGTSHAFLFSGTSAKDLGSFAGASAATDVNRAGSVVGYSVTSVGNQKAFVWTKNGGMASLRTLGGSASDAT